MQHQDDQDCDSSGKAPEATRRESNRHTPNLENLALLFPVLFLSRPVYSAILLFDAGYASPLFWVGAGLATVIGLCVSVYRQAARIEEETQSRKHRIAAIEKSQQEMREAGSAAESRVADMVLQIAREFDPKATVETGLVLNYPNPRSDQMPQFEVDCLLTWQFGLVLIEVKNWRGTITILPEEWVVVKQDTSMRHKSPVDQSAPKKRAIEQILQASNPEFFVESIVVLSHESVSIPTNAPLAVMCPTDLRFYLRTLYHAATRRASTTPAQIDVIRHQIDHAVDRTEDAKHQFLLQLARRKIGAFEYLELDEKLQKIKEEALPLPRSPWHFATTYIPLLLYMLVVHLPSVFQEKSLLLQSSAASTSSATMPSQANVNGAKRISTTRKTAERSGAQ